MAALNREREELESISSVCSSLTNYSILTGGIANLNVGPDEVPFDVHIELICARSTFFDNALKGRFAEATSKVIPLPDEHPDTFNEFLWWLYTDKVFKGQALPSWDQAIRLWILADKFGVPDLCNAVVHAMAKRFPKGGRTANMTPDLIDFLYPNSVEGSAIRRLVVDICAWGMDSKMFEMHRAKFRSDFVEDFALVQTKRVHKEYPDDKAPFELHMGPYLVIKTEPRVTAKEVDKSPETTAAATTTSSEIVGATFSSSTQNAPVPATSAQLAYRSIAPLARRLRVRVHASETTTPAQTAVPEKVEVGEGTETDVEVDTPPASSGNCSER